VLLLVCNDVSNQLFRNNFLVVSKTVNQRGIAEHVNHAGDTAARGSDQRTCLHGKQWSGRADGPKAEVDIVGDLLLIQRTQMEIGRDALGELMQARGEQQFAQLRLSDEDQLQDLKFVSVDIGNHSQVFERFRREILRLVDDQDGSPSIGKLAVKI